MRHPVWPEALRACFRLSLALAWLWAPGIAQAASAPGSGAAPKRDLLPDDYVLATVGARKVTVYEFRRSFFASDATLRPSTDSLGRVQFLHDLVDKETLGQAAQATGYQFGFEDRAEMRDYRKTLLSNQLFAVTSQTAPISDDSLRRVVGYYGRDLRLRLLYFPEREQAEITRQQLLSGRLTWGVATAKYGLTTSTVTNGISDWLKFANLPVDVALPLWSLRVGQTSPLIPAASGYHLAQIFEERQGKAFPFNAMRATVKRQLQEAEGKRRRTQIQDEAKLGMDVVYDTTNVRWASSFFRAAMRVEKEGLGNNVIVDPNVPEFTNEDTARTLVSWKGGRLSLGTILHEYTELQPLVRPSLNTPDNLVAFVDAVMLGPKMTEIAEKRGLDKDPIVVEVLERRRESILVSHMVEDSVLNRISVTKDERREYYKAHEASFVTFPRVRYGALVRTTKTAADSTVRLLQTGASFDSLLAIDKAAGVVGSDSSEVGANDSSPYHKLLFEELRPGKASVIGPDKQKLYAVLYEKSYDPGRLLPFEMMENTIDESVRNIKGDQALRAFIERLSVRFPAVAEFDKVMRIRLTDPTLNLD